MLKIIPMMKRSFIMGFLKYLLRSASEIIREISIMIDTEIVRNCLSTFGN